MANFKKTVREFTRIAVPYYRSEDRWAGRVLLFSVISLQLFQVWLNVRFNAWYNTFYTALQDKDWNTFIWQLGVFSLLAAFFIVSAVYQLYLQQWLIIRWRNWLTQRYIGRWLGLGTHYRMRLKGDQADNPDQRIADDLRLFVVGALTLSIGGMRAVVTLVSFLGILWILSGPLTLPIGAGVTVPGYMVWAALLYAIAGTWLSHLIGRPLVRLNFDQQRYEADFRFNLVRFRENTEGVALYGGEADEMRNFRERFSSVVGNWWDIMRRQKRLSWFTYGYGQGAQTDGATAVVIRHDAHEALVHFVKSVGIDLQQFQGGPGHFQGNDAIAALLGEVADKVNQVVGNAWCAAGPAGDFQGAGLLG